MDLRQEKDKLIPQNSSRNYFLSKLLNEKYGQVAATVFHDKNSYWIYHKDSLEQHEDEKANPGEKLWLLIRHMQADKEHKFAPREGFNITLGDTIKFGRVRYKIVQTHTLQHGVQKYDMHDRFFIKKKK